MFAGLDDIAAETISLDSPLVKPIREILDQDSGLVNFIFIMYTGYNPKDQTCFGYIYLKSKVDTFLELAAKRKIIEYSFEEKCFKKDLDMMTFEIPTKTDFRFQPSFCYLDNNGQLQTPSDVLKMMLCRKNLIFADLKVLHKTANIFLTIPEEPTPNNTGIDCVTNFHFDNPFVISEEIEKKILKRHSNLGNQWRVENSKDGF